MAAPNLFVLLLIASLAFALIFFFVLLIVLLWRVRRRTGRSSADRLRACTQCHHLCSPRAAMCPKCGCRFEAAELP